ncbi:hypothetical protein BH20ACI3_BH20ACI3_42580 [soil metagenome]
MLEVADIFRRHGASYRAQRAAGYRGLSYGLLWRPSETVRPLRQAGLCLSLLPQSSLTQVSRGPDRALAGAAANASLALPVLSRHFYSASGGCAPWPSLIRKKSMTYSCARPRRPCRNWRGIQATWVGGSGPWPAFSSLNLVANKSFRLEYFGFVFVVVSVMQMHRLSFRFAKAQIQNFDKN